MANEIVDSADVMRELFGEREGLTHQTRNALPQSILEALDVVGFACFLCNGLVPIRGDHSCVGVILIRMRPVSSNGAENRVKASSLLNRFSILLKNKRYMDGRNPASLRVTVAVRLCSHRKRPLRRHGDQRATFMQAIGFISLMIDGV